MKVNKSKHVILYLALVSVLYILYQYITFNVMTRYRVTPPTEVNYIFTNILFMFLAMCLGAVFGLEKIMKTYRDPGNLTYNWKRFLILSIPCIILEIYHIVSSNALLLLLPFSPFIGNSITKALLFFIGYSITTSFKKEEREDREGNSSVSVRPIT